MNVQEAKTRFKLACKANEPKLLKAQLKQDAKQKKAAIKFEKEVNKNIKYMLKLINYAIKDNCETYSYEYFERVRIHGREAEKALPLMPLFRSVAHGLRELGYFVELKGPIIHAFSFSIIMDIGGWAND